MHTYSTKSNAKAGAMRKLGKDAKEGTSFTLAGSGKEWSWTKIGEDHAVDGEVAAAETKATEATPKAKAARANKPRAKPAKEKTPRKKLADSDKPSVRLQPRMMQVYAMIERTEGATVKDIAAKYSLKPDTVRGMLSLQKTDGAHLHTVREGRCVRYFSRKAEATEHAREIAAETEAHAG